jgi:hypothetical protein
MEFVFPHLLRKPPPLNRDQLLMLQEDNIGNSQPANELFGLKPVPLREGIARYLNVKREAGRGRRLCSRFTFPATLHTSIP